MGQIDILSHSIRKFAHSPIYPPSIKTFTNKITHCWNSNHIFMIFVWHFILSWYSILGGIESVIVAMIKDHTKAFCDAKMHWKLSSGCYTSQEKQTLATQSPKAFCRKRRFWYLRNTILSRISMDRTIQITIQKSNQQSLY